MHRNQHRGVAVAESRRRYRVKFLEKNEKNPVTVTATAVQASEYFGMIAIEGLVFDDRRRHIILPDEDSTRRRFAKTNRLHIPYHNVICIEEFDEDPPDLKKLPFIKQVELNGGAVSDEQLSS